MRVARLVPKAAAIDSGASGTERAKLAAETVVTIRGWPFAVAWRGQAKVRTRATALKEIDS